MARSHWVLVIPSPNQNRINNILKFTYSQIISQMNSFAFRIHIDIVTMGRIRQASVTPSQIWNVIIKILDCYTHHRSLSPEEFIRAKLNSYHRRNCHYLNKNLIWTTNKSFDREENFFNWLFVMINSLDMSRTMMNTLTTSATLIRKKQWYQKQWYAP